MTRITVHIEGESAFEVHEALMGLASMRVEPKTYPADVDPRTTARAADVETRIAAANAAPLVPDTAPKATRAKAAKVEETKAADVFAEQVRQMNDEAKAEAAQPQGEATFKMVQDALAAYSSKNSMIKAREVLATFKNAEGGPVARISEVQPADFGDVLAKLSA